MWCATNEFCIYCRLIGNSVTDALPLAFNSTFCAWVRARMSFAMLSGVRFTASLVART
jgi:hypothetical protein